MTNDLDALALAIFDWLSSDDEPDPPYTYNGDRRTLMIGVDDTLDCRAMADGILRRLNAS